MGENTERALATGPSLATPFTVLFNGWKTRHTKCGCYECRGRAVRVSWRPCLLVVIVITVGNNEHLFSVLCTKHFMSKSSYLRLMTPLQCSYYFFSLFLAALGLHCSMAGSSLWASL